MKKVIVATMAVALAFSAQADLSINYLGSYGTTGPDGVSPLLTTGQQALIQLIYAGGNGVLDGAAGVGGTVGGDDVILFQGLSDPATSGDFTLEYATFAAGTIDALGIAGGNVFGRVFQDSAAGGGSYYHESAAFLASNVNLAAVPPPTPDTFNIYPGPGAVADQQVVPEPATIGLMGVAGLGMFLARRRTR